MTDAKEMLALADRIDATKRSWLPIAGHVVNVTFGLHEADQISAALRLAAQSAPRDEVGVAGNMPGTTGFTMAAFEAAKVPVGTKLYASASVSSTDEVSK